MLKKITATFISFFILELWGMSPALAHVIVSPSQTTVASSVTFSVSVPNEENTPTIALRLTMPPGLKEVSPYVKPGWNISLKKDNNSNVTEIDWTGGSTPVGEADEFLFRAQVPPQAVTLDWKAYQAYQNGDVVSWDQDPASIKIGEEGNPYSQTKVINDLTAPQNQTDKAIEDLQNKSDLLIGLSFGAIILALIALGSQFFKK